ncbi:MAG TPA: hypothetical protein VF023_07790, partial [Bryobacteraceae bacterium]
MDKVYWMVFLAAGSRLARATWPILLPLVALAATARGQIIEFDSNGLHYQAMTRSGVTVTFAKLPPHIAGFNCMQVTVTNGSLVSWTVKPGDFSFDRQDGTVIQASPADVVIDTLLSRATKSDVVKLQLLYEATIYALPPNFRSTAGYEHRREQAMTVMVNSRIKAAVAASAITLVPTKLKPGGS